MSDSNTGIDLRTRLAAALATISIVAVLSCLFYRGFSGWPLT